MMDSVPIIPIPGFSEPAACLSHLAAAFAWFFFVVALLHRGRGNGLRLIALLVYGVCALYLFSMSGVYHLLEPGGQARIVLQRLDHSGIWAMIAGTFTPIHVILFRGLQRWGVLLFVWTVAITGLTLEVVFFTDFPEWLSLSLYLILGWVGLLTYVLYIKTHKEGSVKDLVLGGIAYSFGAIIEYLRWPTPLPGVIGPHEVFHFFVIVGVSLHARFIYRIADICIKGCLTFVIKVRGESDFYVVAKGENISFQATSLQEVRAKINTLLAEKYSLAHRPQAVRLQYIQEEFFSSHTTTTTPKACEIFHGK